jgi:group I intron endonuclease
MQSGIYRITSPTNRIYIGSSKNVHKRLKSYKNINNVKLQTRVYNSFLKHGIDKHIFEIICYCDFDDLYKLENYYGLLFDVCGKNGLNCVIPHFEDIKGKVSEETIEKMRKNCGKKKGIKRTPEMNEANRLRNLGRKHSDETKKKMSENRKGKSPSLEARIKSSITQKGKKVSEETRQKLRNANLGKKYSDETKRKVGLASKNQSPESRYKKLLNTPNRKSFIQYDMDMNSIKEHFSLKQAMRDGLPYRSITRCLKNKHYIITHDKK